MALQLIVEDGSVVAGANSYADAPFITAYALQRGITMPTDDALVGMVTEAMDYLEAMEDRWQGDRYNPTVQSLSWPRRFVTLYRAPLPVNSIPPALKNALAYLTTIVNDGVDLNAVQDTRAVIEDTIGPITTRYSANNGATVKPMIPLLDGMLKPLFRSGGSTLTSVRL